jgi:hypothetical protein
VHRCELFIGHGHLTIQQLTDPRTSMRRPS